MFFVHLELCLFPVGSCGFAKHSSDIKVCHGMISDVALLRDGLMLHEGNISRPLHCPTKASGCGSERRVWQPLELQTLVFSQGVRMFGSLDKK